MWRLTSTEKYPKREVTVIEQSRFYEKSANPHRAGRHFRTKLMLAQAQMAGLIGDLGNLLQNLKIPGDF